MKLRKEVKGVMVGLLVIAGMIALVISDSATTKKAINQCVNVGHSQTYCESGLR